MTVTAVGKGGAPDAYMNNAAPDGNFGTGSVAYCGATAGKAAEEYRPIWRFDLRAAGIPSDATVTLGELWIRVSTVVSNPESETHNFLRITKAGGDPWVESEVTWNDYKSGTAWDSAGGDYDGTVTDSGVGPSGTGWFAFTITNIVQDGHTNRSGEVNFMCVQDLDAYFVFTTRESVGATYDPRLRVTWTLPNQQPSVQIYSG